MPSRVKLKSDKELWALLRKDNKEAFSILYKRHVKSLYTFGLRLTNQKELINDTLQELFIEFWKKRTSLGEVEHVKVYLIKSLRYKLLRVISQASKSKVHSLDELFLNLPDIELQDNELTLERKKILKEKLGKLTERQREVIHLRYFQNLKNEEIAEIINVNYQSVSNILYRALVMLKANMVHKATPQKHRLQNNN